MPNTIKHKLKEASLTQYDLFWGSRYHLLGITFSFLRIEGSLFKLTIYKFCHSCTSNSLTYQIKNPTVFQKVRYLTIIKNLILFSFLNIISSTLAYISADFQCLGIVIQFSLEARFKRHQGKDDWLIEDQLNANTMLDLIKFNLINWHNTSLNR